MTTLSAMGALIPAFSSLIGVLVGGVITYSVSSRSLKHQEWLAKRDFRTKKLEELHGRLTALETYGRHTYTSVRRAFDGGGYENPEILHGLQEIEFLVRTLFPEKPELYDQLHDVTMDGFGGLIADAIIFKTCARGSDGVAKANEAAAYLKRLTEGVAAVKKVVYSSMQSLIAV